MPEESPADISRLMDQARAGDEAARRDLFEAVHGELLVLARNEFRREGSGHTLQPTALVNEAWLRLDRSAQDFENQAQFFGAAARAMRRILIDHARRSQAAKRGGGGGPVTLTDVEDGGNPLSVLEVEDALQALERHDKRLAAIVQLRFFGGLTVEEVARVQGVSLATVKRDWTYARAWLLEKMEHPDE